MSVRNKQKKSVIQRFSNGALQSIARCNDDLALSHLYSRLTHFWPHVMPESVCVVAYRQLIHETAGAFNIPPRQKCSQTRRCIPLLETKDSICGFCFIIIYCCVRLSYSSRFWRLLLCSSSDTVGTTSSSSATSKSTLAASVSAPSRHDRHLHGVTGLRR
jgi:hypothetical protein